MVMVVKEDSSGLVVYNVLEQKITYYFLNLWGEHRTETIPCRVKDIESLFKEGEQTRLKMLLKWEADEQEE